MKNIVLLLAAVLLVCATSCSKDDDLPSHLKGIVSFKSYTSAGGMKSVIFANNQIRFIVELQLSSAGTDLNVDIEYHLLDGTQKVGEGKVKVNKNLDGGMGMFWGSDEHSITPDAAWKGKTITVYLDPANKSTGSQYTSQTYVDLYKKATVVIP
jgi:hypothetical protein